MSRHSGLDSKVYVGDLPRDASEKEVERAFSYYGRLRNVWVARNPPGFAFVEFEDSRDAEDAVKGLDGTTLAGGRIRVELSTGKTRPKPWQRNGDRGGDRSSDRGGDRGSDRGGDRGGDRGPVGMGSRRPMSRRPFDPNDRCYECGGRGHYAYDCSRRINGSGGGGSSSRRSNRSTSRSRSRDRRSASRSRSRSRLRETRDGSRDKSRDRSRERSRGSSRGRSRGSRSRSASRSPA